MQHLLLLQSVSGIIPAQLASSSSTSDLTVWLNLAASDYDVSCGKALWLDTYTTLYQYEIRTE